MPRTRVKKCMTDLTILVEIPDYELEMAGKRELRLLEDVARREPGSFEFFQRLADLIKSIHEEKAKRSYDTTVKYFSDSIASSLDHQKRPAAGAEDSPHGEDRKRKDPLDSDPGKDRA